LGFLVVSSLIVLTTLGVYSFYFFYALRFLHVAIPLVGVLAAVGVSGLVDGTDRALGAVLGRRAYEVRAAVAGGVAMLICLQLAGDLTASSWWQATVLKRSLDTERPADINTDTSAYSAMQLVSAYTEPDATVVEDVDPELFSAYQSTSQRRVVLLNSQSALPTSVSLPRLRDAPHVLDQLLARGKPVYFVGNPTDLLALYDPQVVTIRPMASMQSRADTVTLYRLSAGAAG
jgi:hypothetical protein